MSPNRGQVQPSKAITMPFCSNRLIMRISQFNRDELARTTYSTTLAKFPNNEYCYFPMISPSIRRNKRHNPGRKWRPRAR